MRVLCKNAYLGNNTRLWQLTQELQDIQWDIVCFSESFFLSFFPTDLLAHGASGQRTIVNSISEKYCSWFETKLNYTTLPT